MSDETQTSNTAKADTATLPDGIIAIIELKKPLTDQEGQIIKTLEIKEPTGADYARIGDPFVMTPDANGNMQIQTNTQNALAYLVACTTVQKPFLMQMHIHDMMKATGAISAFLGQG